MARRNRLWIIMDILSYLKNNQKTPLTRVSYGANLPYDRLVKIVNELVEKGLVGYEVENDKKLYYLTRKGYELLKELERVRKILDKMGLLSE